MTSKPLALAITFAIGLSFGSSMAGCGSDDRTSSAPSTPLPRAGFDAGPLGANADAASGPPDAGPSIGGATFGGLPLVEIADEGCVPAVGETRTLYAAELATSGFAPAIDRVERVGASRVAGGSEAQGFVTFAAGAAPSALVTPTIDFNLFASEGDAIAAAGGALGEVVFRRFDERGDPLGPTTILARAVPDALGIAAHASASLVVWASEGALSARAVVAGAPAAGPWTISSGSYRALTSIATGASADAFAIAWTGDDAASVHRTRVVLASKTGVLDAPAEVLATAHVVRVVRVAPTSTGWALLIRSGAPEPRAFVLLLDGSARPTGSVHVLSGVTSGWDLAARGDTIAIVAPREDGAPAVRAFAIEGASLRARGAWACLDDAGDGGALGAIDVDDDGWLVVHRAQDGATRATRLPRSVVGVE